MAFTQTDLDNIDLAIKDFALGKRIGQITVCTDTVRYADVTLDQLQNLRRIVAASVVAVKSRAYARNGGRG